MFKSLLKSTEGGTGVGLATAGGVYAIYANALPNVATVRASAPHDTDLEAARKAAAWKSALLIAAVFVVARDLNSYIISGVALVGIDYMHKHANGVHPATGKLDVAMVDETISDAGDNSVDYSMPSYTDDGE